MSSDAPHSSSNVDQAELDKFSALASRWWDPNSEFKPLHAINPLRLEWIKRLVGGLHDKTVLDVGCGGGILAESMALAGGKVTGIDLADKSLMVAKLHDPGSIVRACATLVKPGGWVFFSTLNRNPKSFLFAIVGAEYILRLLPRGTHSWRSFVRPSELAASARAHGLTTQELIGMGYNPFTQTYSLNQDTSVNYLMATRK